MKKLFSFVFFHLLLIQAVWAQSIVAWDFADTDGVSSKSASTVATGLSSSAPAGVASLGSGLTAIDFHTGNALTGINQTGATLQEAINLDDYISFTVSPESGYAVTIDTILIRPLSQNVSRTFSLLSSVNGFSSSEVIGSFSSDSKIANAPLEIITTPAHTEIITATEFRVYFHGPTNRYESVGIGSGPGDDLIVQGSVSQIPTVPIGFSNNFNDGLTTGFSGSSHFTVTNTGEQIKIKGNKKAKWVNVYYALPQLIDISANPYVNVKLNAAEAFPYKMTIYVRDSEGNSHNVTKRVFATDYMHEVFFDMSGSSTVNYAAIEAVMFAINGAALTWNGEAYLDGLRLGAQATKKANIKNIGDLSYYKNGGSKSIVITDIEYASTVTISGGSTLIENSTVSAISNSEATWSFDIKEGVSGTENITITANSASGYANNAYTIQLSVDDNQAPVLGALADVEVTADVQQKISLTGLTDGDANAEQSLTLTASSSNTSVVSNPAISYTQGEKSATLSFTPNAGIATVTVTVSDGHLSTSQEFTVTAYNNFNYEPTVKVVSDDFVNTTQTDKVITLEGISDGNDGNQTITISASSSDTQVLANPIVNYTAGESTANLSFTPVAEGTSTVTVTLTDNGGTAGNNGNKSNTITFDVDVIPSPITGYSYSMTNFSDDTTANLWAYNSMYNLSYTNFDGHSNVMKITYSGKSTWDGIASQLPQEMDGTNQPFISYEAYPADKDMWMHIYFYDNNNDRNADGAHAERVQLTANEWNEVFFNFSKEGYLLDKNGEPINTKRIKQILINVHDNNFSWPFSTTSGTVYVKNLKMGDDAIIPSSEIESTISGIPNQVHQVNNDPEPVTLTLSGISNGKGTTSGVSLSVSTTKSSVANPQLSSVNADGTATLTYTPGTSVDSAEVRVIVSATNTLSDTVSFWVHVVSPTAGNAKSVAIDPSVTYQTMEGFGTFSIPQYLDNFYTEELGASVMRIGFFDDMTQIEPVNDNDDPNVLNRDALNYNVFDWSFFRELHDKGVENFILSSWSPPAWMKDNLSTNYMQAGAEGNTDRTDNRLAYQYYDEFAESMVAIALVFEEKVGVPLYGIGLQNEPVFHQPYASAILDPKRFKELIKVVGARFEQEGITTRLFMPEQVFSQNTNSNAKYLDSIQADAIANRYTYSLAVHGYASDGVGEGQPDFSDWTTIYNNAQEGTYPKPMWMTETWPELKTWTKAMNQIIAMYGALTYGNVTLWTYWQINGTLYDDRQKKPTPGFYSHAGLFKNVKPGAVRVSSSSQDANIYVMTFKNDADHGGNYATILINNNDYPVTVQVNYASGAPGSLDVFTARESSGLEQTGNGIAVNSVISLSAKSVSTVVGKPGGVSATGDGLYGQYFNNKTFTDAPALTRVDETVNFSWGQASPHASVNADNFSVRWAGKIETPVSGNYVFSTRTDDGVRLYIDGQLVIDKWVNQAATTWTSPSISLVEGQKYDVVMEYYENGGRAVAQLSWSYPNQSTQIIPKAYLYSEQLSNEVAMVRSHEEVVVQEQAMIYPNPSDSRFTLSFATEEEGASQIYLMSLDGRIVYSQEAKVEQGMNIVEVNHGSLDPGIYVLRIENIAAPVTLRVLIK